MKKLMIAACAVALAAFANAATATWGTDENTLLDPSGNDVSWDGKGYVKMYLWAIDSTTYGTLNEGGADGVSAAVWGAYGDKLDTAIGPAVEEGGGQLTLVDEGPYGVGGTAYAAVLLTYDEGDGITHYKGNIASWTFEADVDNKSNNMDSFVYGDTNGTELAWSAAAVPEPTSGLLLLLGVAGLALRRRRA